MAERSVRGKFVWNELITPDTAGAHDFYSKALGWKAENWDLDPSYRLFVTASGPVGGSVADTQGAPQWLPYIGVEDVNAAVEQASGLGAKVIKAATPMPNGGSYAVLADPQGGRFGVYASTSEHPDGAPKPGEFSWYELAAADYQSAFDFYSSMFGWERIAEHDMGPLGVYLVFGQEGRQKGGMFNKPEHMGGQALWLGYVRVKNADKVVQNVKAARGALINGPMEVPGGDWIAQFTDPYGAMFAVHVLAADVKKPAAAAPARQQEQGALAAPEEATGGAAATKRTAARGKKKAKPAGKQGAKKAAVKAAARPKAAKQAVKKVAKKAAKTATAKGKSAKKKAGGKAAKVKQRGKVAGSRKTAAKRAPVKKRPAAKRVRRAGGGAKKKAPARKK